jgi:hypothetical protein
MPNKENLEYVKSKARNTKRRNSNCMGTAFYLVGEQKNDVSIGRDKSLEMLSVLEDSEAPEEGNIVYWRNNGYLIHAGVVFDKDSLTMVHRSEKKGILETSSIERLNSYFGPGKYKVPNKFS